MATNTIQSFGGDIDIGSNLTVNTNTFHVDSVSGRVGIGKTNPAYVLDVGGILNASSIYKGGTPLIGSPWTTAGNVIYRASGNTGIGTNNPQQALEIYDGALRISNTSNSSNVEMYGSRDWYEQAGITASNGTSSDYFGYSVAISSDGNTVIVGAYGVGYAYIRTRTGTTWSSDVILYASDRVSGENFGYNVAISEDGNTALVGAYTANSQGAAYVYVKPGGGWSTTTETAKLTASDIATSDDFGIGVSISRDGNTALVGAYSEDPDGITNAGAAYVYVKPGGGWSTTTETAKLTASDKGASDYFGSSVSISEDGNTALVGAVFEDPDGTTNAGAAYVYVKPGGGWSTTTETAKLTASDKGASDYFGISVSISWDGNTALVGAYTANSQGAAYVYVKPGGGWSNVTETAKLTASDKAASDNFGISVSISGDGNTALVGAYDEDYLASASGSAYLYFKPGSGWSNVTETTKLTASDPQSSDNFGRAVAISGNGTTAIIGAPNEDTIASNAGKAYIFEGRNVLHIGGSLNYTGSIISFTGQHICFPYGNIEQGLVVSSNQNKYMNLNGKLTTGLNAITSSESLPIVSLSNIAYDKSVFGVVDNVEAIGSTTRTSEYTKGPKELGDNRVIVNSVGEGALWVVNTNGPLIAGDYITTSNIVGYGQKQDDDTIKNYTVAKITMDCDFNPPDQPIQIIKKDENGINVLDEYGRLQWEDSEKTEKMYSLRYLTIDGVQTDQANVVWTAAYVGCTYHCG